MLLLKLSAEFGNVSGTPTRYWLYQHESGRIEVFMKRH